MIGYLVQAYSARRAEATMASQAQETHTREQTRQREHEQMTAQVLNEVFNLQTSHASTAESSCWN
eukprot:SAG31_NODE_17355_length_674_cov_0.888696_2_plen_64_part_01